MSVQPFYPGSVSRSTGAADPYFGGAADPFMNDFAMMPSTFGDYSMVPQSWNAFDMVPSAIRGSRNTMMKNEAFQPLAPLMNADLIESETDFHVHADLPGVEDLDINIDGRVLRISANRKVVHEVDNDIVYRKERSFGKVQRKILLPDNADSDKAVAKFKDGVLTVTFPKLPSTARGRKLTIN